MPAGLKRYSGHDYRTFSPVVVIIDSLGWQVPTGAFCSCKSSKKFASATCLWWWAMS